MNKIEKAKKQAIEIENAIKGWEQEGNFLYARYEGAGAPLGKIIGIKIKNAKIIFAD